MHPRPVISTVSFAANLYMESGVSCGIFMVYSRVVCSIGTMQRIYFISMHGIARPQGISLKSSCSEFLEKLSLWTFAIIL